VYAYLQAVAEKLQMKGGLSVMQPEFWALPIIKILLITIIFLSLLVEVKTAGMGIGALLGMIAAGVFFFSQLVTGMVSFFEIAVFLGGVLFIVIELLTPGIGIFAGLGMIAILYSFIFALGGGSSAIYLLLVSLMLAIVIFALIVRKLPSSKLWSKVILKDMSTVSKGYISTNDYSEFLGKEGHVITELRPAGTAFVDDVKLDVVSEGSYIEKDAKIKVVSIHGSRIVVRRI
jgi:membrane-bound serine protease (ClpP class)